MSPMRTKVHHRNAAATRMAILTSARQAFARVGYDGAGLREIAKGAGVTAMLVNRYFGSKERLYAEVVADTMATPSVLTRESINSAAPGKDIATALIDRTKARALPLDGFLIMLYSLSSRRADAIQREQIESHHHRAMTAAIHGAMAPQRAALLLSVIAGFQVMRQMIGLSALAEADSNSLKKILAPVFQLLIDGRATKRK
jgi:AcrR family transcriptional regulator